MSVPVEVPEQAAATIWQGKFGKRIHDNDDLFHDIEELKGVKVKLHINESVKPVAQRHKTSSFSLKR